MLTPANMELVILNKDFVLAQTTAILNATVINYDF